MFQNLINGKRYIGSSDNLPRRFREYFNTNHLFQHNYMYICRALLKYGSSNFSLTIIEYCDKEKCIEREDFYLSSLQHEYNILEKAGSSFGRKHSDDTKKKISDAITGIKRSEETKQKISDALTGLKHSDESRKKMSAAKLDISQKISVFDNDNNETITYDSIGEAARGLNIKKSVIVNYFARNQQKPYKKRYTFKKI
jgi:group I intron endonuclease